MKRLIAIAVLFALAVSTYAGSQQALLRRAWVSRGAAVSSAAWSPSNSMPVAWFDASAGVKAYFSAPNWFATNWASKAAGSVALNTLVGGSFGPYVRTNTYPYLEGTTFAGLSGAFPSTSGTSNMFVIMVADKTSASANHRVVSFAKDTGEDWNNAGAWFLGELSSDTWGIYRNSSDRSKSGAQNGMILIAAELGPFGNVVWTNAVNCATNTYTASLDFNKIAIFNEPSGGAANSPSKIYELLVTTNAVDAPTRQKYEGYLAWRYGLQGSLPANHPYKASAP